MLIIIVFTEKKMQIENKFFNRAFGELPNSQCELNQLPPEESEKAKYKEDIPGNHKISKLFCVDYINV